MTTWFQLQITTAGIFGDNNATARRIAQVKVGEEADKKKRKDQKQPKEPTGKDSDGKTLKIHTSTYPGKDYRNLTSSQLTQVRELRAKEKAQKRKAAAVQKADEAASSDSDTSVALNPAKKTKFKLDKNGRRIKSMKRIEPSDESDKEDAKTPPPSDDAFVSSDSDESTDETVDVVEVVTPPKKKKAVLKAVAKLPMSDDAPPIPKKRKNAGDQFGKAAHVAHADPKEKATTAPVMKRKKRSSKEVLKTGDQTLKVRGRTDE
jgi:hypothetical protein